MSWSLEIDGVKKTLAEWGLSDVRLHLVNLSIDRLTAGRDLARFDADPLCAYGDIVTLFKPDGTRCFSGERVLVPAAASGPSEVQSYTFEGPWRWLARNLYKQQWRGAIGGVLQSIYVSHIIKSGTIAQIITRVLQYAIDRGAPLQLGTIDIPVAPPIDEVIDQTCAQVISDALQYAPDAVGWFDYSTTPATFHCRQRANLTPVELPFAPASVQPTVSVISIQPRPDLQVPSVELSYEVTNDVDGVPKYGFFRDRWPLASTGLEDGCLSSTISLQGFSATHVRNTLVAETINTGSIAWWKKVFPNLADPKVDQSSIVILASSRTGADGLTSLGLGRRLLEGQCTEWMTNPDGSALVWDEDVFTLDVSLDVYETVGAAVAKTASGKIKTYKTLRLTCSVMTVNAPTGETEYENLETFAEGDAVPSNLARYLYESLSTLHFDARIELVENECLGATFLGRVLNVSGSRPEFTTMRALIQDVVFSIDGGQTIITAGPPSHLSLSDLLALLKANRVRRRWTNVTTQDTGALSGPSNVQLGQGTAGANSINGQGVATMFAVKDADNKITLDAKHSLFARVPAGSKTLEVRLATVCVRDANGIQEEKYALVVMGAPFAIGSLLP